MSYKNLIKLAEHFERLAQTVQRQGSMELQAGDMDGILRAWREGSKDNDFIALMDAVKIPGSSGANFHAVVYPDAQKAPLLKLVCTTIPANKQFSTALTIAANKSPLRAGMETALRNGAVMDTSKVPPVARVPMVSAQKDPVLIRQIQASK